MAKVNMKHLTKTYDNGFKAIDDVSLEIEDHEFMVFVGPSGCGKTTLLRMIAGLEEITSGDLEIDGILANGLEPKDRQMAMVFQNYALFPHMTNYENIAYGLKRRGEDKARIDQRVREAAKILNLEDHLNLKPNQLSGGQMQRVALGRAMVMNPKVFLMDEPLSNLDTALKGQMRKELMKLHKRLETTFIYVTHDQTEAMTMGTRICVINEGHIQQVDTPNKIYNKPENTFVAEFIGTPKINLLKADILKDPTVKGELVFDFGAFDMRAKEELLAFNLEASMGGVTVGFRPQDVIVRNLEHPKSDFFEIDLIEILGSDCILHLKRDKLGITALVSNDIAYKIGGAVAIELKPEKCHFFDLETGIRL